MKHLLLIHLGNITKHLDSIILDYLLGNLSGSTISGNSYDFTTSSISDYTYSSNLLGRSENEGFFSQQYFKNDAGFK